ncbi:hypothetical protein HDE_05536 [Halotydeus destructor]|nr:hypothetical protein HDE_05536 [Halotydeus destructor]
MSTRFRNGFAHLFRFVLCAPREMAEDNGQLLHGQQHGGARGNSAFATIQKYHRQMILLACGEPTQISTDSLPMESQHTVQGSVTHLRTPKNEGHHHHHRHHRNDTALNQLTKAAMLHLNPISSAELKSRSLTWFDLRDVQSNGSAHVRTLCPSDLHDHNGVNLANGCHRLSRSFSEMALPVLFKGHNNAVPMASDGQPELVSPANPSGQVDVNGQLSKGPLGTSCIRASRFGHLKCSTKENVPLGQTYATKGSSCDLEHLAYIDSEV